MESCIEQIIGKIERIWVKNEKHEWEFEMLFMDFVFKMSVWEWTKLAKIESLAIQTSAK